MNIHFNLVSMVLRQHFMDFIKNFSVCKSIVYKDVKLNFLLLFKGYNNKMFAK